MVYMIECQTGYVMDCLKKMDRHELHSIEVRQDVQQAYNRERQFKLGGTVWHSGCQRVRSQHRAVAGFYVKFPRAHGQIRSWRLSLSARRRGRRPANLTRACACAIVECNCR